MELGAPKLSISPTAFSVNASVVSVPDARIVRLEHQRGNLQTLSRTLESGRTGRGTLGLASSRMPSHLR